MTTVEIVRDYPCSTDELWAVATDIDCLADAADGLVRYDGLPHGQLHQGQVINVRVSLLGRLKSFPYTIQVLEADPQRMVARSHELGGGVKAWNYTLTIAPTPTGSRLTEHVEIDAGLLSGLYALWARHVYRRRHAPRLRLLALRAARHDNVLEHPEPLLPFFHNDNVSWQAMDGALMHGSIIAYSIVRTAKQVAEYGKPIDTVMVLVKDAQLGHDHWVPHDDLRKG